MESYNCQFPDDIITDIVSRLPAVFILSLKQVCRTWRNLLDGPHFARIHLRRHQKSLGTDIHGNDNTDACNNYKVSFLCFLKSTENPCGNSIHYREYFDDKFQNFSKKKFQLNFDGSLVGSCNGLICFSSDYRTEVIRNKCRWFIDVNKDPTYVFNPVTGEELSLPKVTILDNFVNPALTLASGFGYLPATNEYKVVRIYYEWKDQTKIGKVQVYTLGGENSNNQGHWRDKGIISHGFSFPQLNGIFYNGALHWVDYQIGYKKRIIAFDLAKEEFFFVKSPPCFEVGHGNAYQLCHLGDCLGIYHNKDYHSRKNRSCDIWVLKKIKKTSTCVMDENGEYYDSSWSWRWIFGVDQTKLSYHDYLPLAVMNNGDILFKYCQGSALCIFDSKMSTFKTISCAINRDRGEQYTYLVHHVNTFVSLNGMA